MAVESVVVLAASLVLETVAPWVGGMAVVSAVKWVVERVVWWAVMSVDATVATTVA